MSAGNRCRYCGANIPQPHRYCHPCYVQRRAARLQAYNRKIEAGYEIPKLAATNSYQFCARCKKTKISRLITLCLPCSQLPKPEVAMV